MSTEEKKVKTFAEKIFGSNIEDHDSDPLVGALTTASQDLRVAAYAVDVQDEEQPMRSEIVGVLLRVVARVEAVRDELHRRRREREAAESAVKQ